MFKNQLSVKVILISMLLLMVFNKIYFSLHTSYVFCGFFLLYVYLLTYLCIMVGDEAWWLHGTVVLL